MAKDKDQDKEQKPTPAGTSANTPDAGNNAQQPIAPASPVADADKAAAKPKGKAPAEFVATTPNQGFMGERAGVRFVNGRAVVPADQVVKARELKRFGYTVEPDPG